MKITMMIHVDVDDDNDDITDTAIYKSMNIKYKCFMYVHTVSAMIKYSSHLRRCYHFSRQVNLRTNDVAYRLADGRTGT